MKNLYDRKMSTIYSFPMLEAKIENKGKRIPLIADIMFNSMINNRRRKKYVALLISVFFNYDYKDVYENIEILKNKIDKRYAREAGRELDCVCSYNGVLYDIELNNSPDKERLDRNEDYIRALFSDRELGEDYHYNEVIQLNLNNYSFEGVDRVIQEYKMYNEEDSISMSERIKIYHVALNKVNKKWYNKEELTRLELLMVVFNEIEDTEYLDGLLEERGEKIMQEYRDESKVVSSDSENWIAYENERLHQVYAKKKEKRLKSEGRLEGKSEEKIATAKKMKQCNESIDKIKLYTGLSTEKIKSISI